MGVLMKNKVCYTGGNVKVQPVIYSTDEREIGVWTDGKPLYQKTIYCGATGGYETTISVNHGISNIDKFIFIFGCFGDGEPVPTVNGGSDYIRLSADSTKIYIKYRDSWDSHTNINVTVQYTKTTDTAGSGIWATNGAPAKHYSTTEQIIGTWIDGSTIYEKSIVFTSSLSSGTTNYIPLGVTNIDKIVSVEGFVSYGSHIRYIPLPYGDSGNSNVRINAVATDDNTINIYVGSDYSGSSAIDITLITIRYTKTS